MKNHIETPMRFVRKPAATLSATGLCLLFAILTNSAKAQTQYFEPVATGQTYSWDQALWSANGAANASPYTSSWVAGNFARFYNGTGDTYTVTVNAAESMDGIYLDSGSATTLSINDAGNNTGSLSVVANTSQATQNGFSWLTQAFLTGGGTLNLNAPITGSGGVEEESGGGNINLYGNNSFTGGFLATSSSTFIGFNNNNSFGAGQIGFDGTTFAIMNNTGPTSVNIANNVQTIGATGVDFIGNSSTFSGNWYLGGGSSAINIRNNGAAGSTVTLGSATTGLSGTSGAVTFSGANGGVVVLAGQNTYTGSTVVGSSGDTAITLQMAIANGINTSSSLVMAGGTFNAGGFNQANNGTLGLTASSTLDFGATSGTALSFANSSGVAWTTGKVLNLADWQGNSIADGGTSTDTLEIGTGSGGLTSAQLAEIEFNGNAATLGTAVLDSNGYIEEVPAVPEPSTLVLGVLGGLGVIQTLRRKS